MTRSKSIVTGSICAFLASPLCVFDLRADEIPVAIPPTTPANSVIVPSRSANPAIPSAKQANGGDTAERSGERTKESAPKSHEAAKGVAIGAALHHVNPVAAKVHAAKRLKEAVSSKRARSASPGGESVQEPGKSGAGSDGMAGAEPAGRVPGTAAER